MKRICSKCGEEKEICEFYKNGSQCRQCEYEKSLTVCCRCEVCKIFFTITPQKSKKGARYCSLYCAGIAKRGIARPQYVLAAMKKTWFKKGHRASPETEFKNGHSRGRRFKKGHVSWNDSNTKLVCKHCGKLFKIKPFRTKRSENNFCSKECADKYKFKGGPVADRKELKDVYVKLTILNRDVGKGLNREDITAEMITLQRSKLKQHRKITKENKILGRIKCATCGKEIYKSPYLRKSSKNNFCSTECARKFYKTGTLCTCDQCGKETYTNPHKIKRNKHNFCSVACHAKFMYRGGYLAAIKELRDAYVKHRIITAKDVSIKRENITPEMIELKREIITLHRLQKELTNGINSRGNQRTSANGKAA